LIYPFTKGRALSLFPSTFFLSIAQADIVGVMTIELLGLFEGLTAENRITDSCSRVVVTKQTEYNKFPDMGKALESELPDWVRPEIQRSG
jgi:uncharacterized membrane protein